MEFCQQPADHHMAYELPQSPMGTTCDPFLDPCITATYQHDPQHFFDLSTEPHETMIKLEDIGQPQPWESFSSVSSYLLSCATYLEIEPRADLFSHRLQNPESVRPWNPSHPHQYGESRHHSRSRSLGETGLAPAHPEGLPTSAARRTASPPANAEERRRMRSASSRIGGGCCRSRTPSS